MLIALARRQACEGVDVCLRRTASRDLAQSLNLFWLLRASIFTFTNLSRPLAVLC